MFNLVICDTRVADSLQSECFHWDLVSMTKPSPFHPFPRHGSSPSHARCYAVHPAPSTWVSPKRSPKPWRCLRVQRLEPQQMGEKLGTDVSPTFPNRCIFRLIILKHVCFRGVYDIDILDFFGGRLKSRFLARLLLDKLRVSQPYPYQDDKICIGEFVYKIVCFHLRWVHDWKHRKNNKLHPKLRKFSCFSQVLRIDWHMFEPRLHLVLKLQPFQAPILVIDMCLKRYQKH